MADRPMRPPASVYLCSDGTFALWVEQASRFVHCPTSDPETLARTASRYTGMTMSPHWADHQMRRACERDQDLVAVAPERRVCAGRFPGSGSCRGDLEASGYCDAHQPKLKEA